MRYLRLLLLVVVAAAAVVAWLPMPVATGSPISFECIRSQVNERVQQEKDEEKLVEEEGKKHMMKKKTRQKWQLKPLLASFCCLTFWSWP